MLVLGVAFSNKRAGMLGKKHSRPVALSGAAIAPPGDICQCLETLWVVMAGDGVLLASSG